MPYFIYNSAPGVMFFRGNEIRAEAHQWTKVSATAVNEGTFTATKRLGLINVAHTDVAPDYDPTKPENRERAALDAPGGRNSAPLSLDGSMTEAELKAMLISEVGEPENQQEPVEAEPEKVTKPAAKKTKAPAATPETPTDLGSFT